MPDFDIDFCQDRRDEVIAYVRDKYGTDRVAQIITFGKLQAGAVIRTWGVFWDSYGQTDRISKLIPNNPPTRQRSAKPSRAMNSSKRCSGPKNPSPSCSTSVCNLKVVP